MKRGIFICIIFYLAYGSMVAQEKTSDEIEKNQSLKLATLLEYSFGSKADLSSITPEIFLGFDTLIFKNKVNSSTIRLRFGPTICSRNTLIDSINCFRAAMMPGQVSFSIAVYSAHLLLNKNISMLLQTGCTIKTIGYLEDKRAVIQENLNAGIGFEYLKLFLVSCNYTIGWHNLTNESENAFMDAFCTDHTRVSYLSFNVESYSQLLKLYFIFNWHKFMNDHDFSEGLVSDTRTISMGIRKELQLTSSAGKKQ
jgi:hypothetical protein